LASQHPSISTISKGSPALDATAASTFYHDYSHSFRYAQGTKGKENPCT